MDEYRTANRRLWDEWAPINARSELYELPQFKAGANKLHPLEREEIGDVSGRTLLHLMCHFGMDTLSWARLGAVVTGIDFSPEAIRMAQELSADAPTGPEWKIAYDAFEAGAVPFEETGCYSDPRAVVRQPRHYEWFYRMGDVVTFLIEAGLRVEFLHEHPFTVYQAFPFLEKSADGYWRAPEGMPRVPLLFSLRAVREG